MKVRVLQQFKCKIDNKTRFKVGSEHEFETERAQNLIERGLAEAIEETPAGDKKEITPTSGDRNKGDKGNGKGSKSQKGKVEDADKPKEDEKPPTENANEDDPESNGDTDADSEESEGEAAETEDASEK